MYGKSFINLLKSPLCLAEYQIEHSLGGTAEAQPKKYHRKGNQWEAVNWEIP